VGDTLTRVLEGGRLPAAEGARVGAALADAVHSLHLQDAIHLDLKPDNMIIQASGVATLIDFGLAHHARFPDLLAEERRFAAGSVPYLSPEQVLGTRSDPRSDIFSLGVVLYEMTTKSLPFGMPSTRAGLRDRLWLDPIPPCARSPDLPPWLQEVVLRCLEPRADQRYQSAAHVAFDLRNPQQVVLTARAHKSRQAGLGEQARRWWKSLREPPRPPRLPKTLLSRVPVIMVAVDTTHPLDDRQPSLQRVTAQLLSLSTEFRLICLSVIRAGPLVEGESQEQSASSLHLEHLVRLRSWVEPLRLPAQQLSLHVIESLNPASTLVDFARRNHVDLIVLGAPGPDQRALAWWRSVASGVTANAHCSVHVVRVPERNQADTAESAGPGPPSETTG
jgi:serine/threonine protein kinase